MLVQRFNQLHPSYDAPDGDAIIAPVMVVQAPPVPDESRFYSEILEQLFASFRHNDRVEKKQYQVIKLLRYINLKVLVIDEIHSILAGNLNKQRTFLNVVKYLGNELQIPIVGVGTKDAFRAIQTDPQLANRFEPVVLQRWSFDNNFLRLLVSFERMLPLREPSNLHESELAMKLLAVSEGYIGELSRLLVQAAVRAVETGKEKIDAKLVDSLGWVAPSERKRHADKVL
ncbi:AAA domain protein [Collimonas arenae]|uniref:AAA domain protein n=2 Tax=Collimonas arenae TaxID=279058 RepID=A0A127QQX4_9BURK|nr:AAA domain protein [Collimonas arenae]